MQDTTFTMESYSFDEREGTSEVTLQKTLTDCSVSDLSEMFLSFLQANGYTYAKGVAVVTDSGDEICTDDYHSYFASESSEPDTSLDYDEPFTVNTSGLYVHADDTVTPSYATDSTYGDVTLHNYGDVKISYGNSIDDATPEEWNHASQYAFNFGKKS